MIHSVSRLLFQSAQEGLVLLQNQNGLLPLNKNTVTKIAVIGNLAEYAPPTGFGSSYVTPINYVSELNGIQSEVGANTEVDFIPLCSLDPPNTIWEYSNNGEITQGLQGQITPAMTFPVRRKSPESTMKLISTGTSTLFRYPAIKAASRQNGPVK